MSAPVQQLRRRLMDVAVSTDSAPMAAYMKQVAPFLGVKAVLRRQVVRQAAQRWRWGVPRMS